MSLRSINFVLSDALELLQKIVWNFYQSVHRSLVLCIHIFLPEILIFIELQQGLWYNTIEIVNQLTKQIRH